MLGKFTHNNIIKYSDKYKASKDNIPLYYSKDTEKNVTVSFYKLSQIIKKTQIMQYQTVDTPRRRCCALEDANTAKRYLEAKMVTNQHQMI